MGDAKEGALPVPPEKRPFRTITPRGEAAGSVLYDRLGQAVGGSYRLLRTAERRFVDVSLPIGKEDFTMEYRSASHQWPEQGGFPANEVPKLPANFCFEVKAGYWEIRSVETTGRPEVLFRGDYDFKKGTVAVKLATRRDLDTLRRVNGLLGYDFFSTKGSRPGEYVINVPEARKRLLAQAVVYQTQQVVPEAQPAA